MKLCFFTLITVAILNITEVSALASEFKLYLDESRTKHIMVEKQDCSVYKSEDGKVTLGFKAGGLFFGIGPELSFGKDSGIDWDKLTQKLVVRYLELCSRYNTGSISKSEYDKRLQKIEEIEIAAYKLYQKIIEAAARQKDQIFKELDEATKQTGVP